MPKVSIQQFRTRLASRSEQGSAVRAYRELSRRPELAAGMPFGEWVTWPPAASPAANV
jgi:hypothetical protein